MQSAMFLYKEEEETEYKRDTILVYRKRHKLRLTEATSG